MKTPTELQLRTRTVIGPGTLARLGTEAAELGSRRSLLVCDSGLVDAGHARRATDLLRGSGVEVYCYHDFHLNPTTRDVKEGAAFAAEKEVDSIIGLGGGSSMDCAKGINFILTNGGEMQDYWGYGKVSKPLLPMIGVPTTAGTGSEAQSYALISDAKTHAKMACGDTTAAFRVAILDPELLTTVPASVRAVAGYDALSHAVETAVTTRANPTSDRLSRDAWGLLERNFEKVLKGTDDLKTLGEMQLGAFHAGAAIEHSMLGATHACANPLTARHDITHGAAIAMLLPTVVRWNGDSKDTLVTTRYAELMAGTRSSTNGDNPSSALAARLEELATIAGLRRTLSEAGVSRSEISALAEDAAAQWTGRFNPRPFDATAAEEIYECIYGG